MRENQSQSRFKSPHRHDHNNHHHLSHRCNRRNDPRIHHARSITTMINTDTPSTDAMVASDIHHLGDDITCSASAYWRIVDVARQLERELSATKDKHAKRIIAWGKEVAAALEAKQKAEQQRDRLAEAAKNLCAALLSVEPRDITDLINSVGQDLAAVKEDKPPQP